MIALSDAALPQQLRAPARQREYLRI